MEWLQRVENYTKELQKSYQKRNGSKIAEKGEHTFKTIHESEQFLTEYLFIQSAQNKNNSQPIVCTQWNHLWVPLFLNQKTYLMLKETAPFTDAYSVTHSNTFLDQWCHKFWQKHLLRTRIGVKNANNRIEIAAIGDTIIQIFHPEYLKKEIDDFYNKTKAFNQLNLNNFFENIFEHKTKIPMTITHNTVLAEQFKQETMGYFKK